TPPDYAWDRKNTGQFRILSLRRHLRQRKRSVRVRHRGETPVTRRDCAGDTRQCHHQAHAAGYGLAWIDRRMPSVEASSAAVGAAVPATCGNRDSASFLPISTPHWSNGLICQSDAQANTLCSYSASRLPSVKGESSSSSNRLLGWL